MISEVLRNMIDEVSLYRAAAPAMYAGVAGELDACVLLAKHCLRRLDEPPPATKQLKELAANRQHGQARVGDGSGTEPRSRDPVQGARET